jgi:bisphosphoglycerate-dependent phosphoglycerate mutase
MKERLTKQDLMKLYGVDRVTIEEWRRNYNLPIIAVSSHSKFIRKEDLIAWETSLIGSSCKI